MNESRTCVQCKQAIVFPQVCVWPQTIDGSTGPYHLGCEQRCTPDLCVCGVYSSRDDGEYETCCCGCPECDNSICLPGSLERAVSSLLNKVYQSLPNGAA